ncbi:hypothetical protein [Gordonia sp. VNK21]|uniref:hypothetical protein n=1 Tax=Gordonia sp. VNK21 TaxID=3382483 RepID=UPI0038D37169
MDLKSLHPFQTGALAAGLVALIFSFFNRFVTASFMGQTAGENAWYSYAVLGMLLIIAATVLVAVQAFAPDVLPATAPWNLITMVVAGLGTLLLLVRGLTEDNAGFTGVDVGIGWTGWIVIIAGTVLTIFSVLSFRDSDEKLPDFSNRN